MDPNSKLFNDHLKLQRDFEYQMDKWDRYSPEARTRKAAIDASMNASIEFGVGSSEHEAARTRRNEAMKAYREAREVQRKGLIERFNRKSFEIGGPGFDAWQDILSQARHGMSASEYMRADGP